MTDARTAPPSLAAPTGASAALPENSERLEPRRVIAFLAMVFGMFMAILDIQIV